MSVLFSYKIEQIAILTLCLGHTFFEWHPYASIFVFQINILNAKYAYGKELVTIKYNTIFLILYFTG